MPPRRLLRAHQLQPETRRAIQEENARRVRLEKIHKEFDGILLEDDLNYIHQSSDTNIAPRQCVKKVILDRDLGQDPPQPLKIHNELCRLLKPHQARGVRFLWESTFESLERFDSGDPGGGGILAHCMGLGKTLQAIAFLQTILAHSRIAARVKRVLVVVPKNVVINWFKEFEMWLGGDNFLRNTFSVDHLDRYNSNSDRLKALKEWHESESPTVMIIGYERFRLLTATEDDKKEVRRRNPQKIPRKKKPLTPVQKEMQEEFRKYLQNPGPDLVICDEAHKLKNCDTTLSRTMARIATQRRLLLTGTPIQNNLNEYHCMVDLAKKHLLGTKKEFRNLFGRPIENGRAKDADERAVSLMRRRCHVLYNQLEIVMNRLDYRVLAEAIPPKQEHVVLTRLTDRQIQLYDLFLNEVRDEIGGVFVKQLLTKRLFSDHSVLMRIWTHPYMMFLREQAEAKKNALIDFDAFDDMDDLSSDEESDVDSENSDSIPRKRRRTRSQKTSSDKNRADLPSTSTGRSNVYGGEFEEDSEYETADDRQVKRQKHNNHHHHHHGWLASDTSAGEDEVKKRDSGVGNDIKVQGWFVAAGLVTEDDAHRWELSGKLEALKMIIRKCEVAGEKLLIFSYSLESLRLIRRMLEWYDEQNGWFVDGHRAAKQNPSEKWGWAFGDDFLVIDGSVSSKRRDQLQTQFNDPSQQRTRLMLISTRAGSLGTNLVAANRVVIFDSSWNPSHDAQALFRVYRFGQLKPVFVYRLVAQGTMEEAIYKRQVTKEAVAKRVIDEEYVDRHFTSNEIRELYNLNVVPFDPRNKITDTMAPPKDRALAEMISVRPELFVSYLEYDSLFAEREDEQLTNDEKEQAWVEFYQESGSDAKKSTQHNGDDSGDDGGDSRDDGDSDSDSEDGNRWRGEMQQNRTSTPPRNTPQQDLVAMPRVTLQHNTPRQQSTPFRQSLLPSQANQESVSTASSCARTRPLLSNAAQRQAQGRVLVSHQQQQQAERLNRSPIVVRQRPTPQSRRIEFNQHPLQNQQQRATTSGMQSSPKQRPHQNTVVGPSSTGNQSMMQMPMSRNLSPGISMVGTTPPHVSFKYDPTKSPSPEQAALMRDPLFGLANYKLHHRPTAVKLEMAYLRHVVHSLLPFLLPNLHARVLTFDDSIEQIIERVHSAGESPPVFVARLVAAFRSIVEICRPVPACMSALRRYYQAAPEFFDPAKPAP